MTDTIARLSRREAQIAGSYARGATYREIAEELGIAPATVRTHLYAVYRKLNVGTKIELLKVLDGTPGFGAPNGSPVPGATPAARPAVAILPFENRSGAPEHDGIIAGLVDRVTGTLSNFRMLFVIAAASSLSYRGSGKDIRSIGEELGARYILRGSFFRDGARMRVTAELVDTASLAHLWSKVYDGAWSGIFELQDDLAFSIAQATEHEIRVREFGRARHRQDSDLTAWELYCQGLEAAYRFTEPGYRTARNYALQAIELDDGFAAPHMLLSRVDFMESILAYSRDPGRSISEGIEHARHALILDPQYDSALCSLACCLVMAGAFDEAFSVIQRAFEVNPNSAEVHNARALAHVFAPNGDLRLVITDSETALRMSPNDPLRWTLLANIGMAHLADEENGALNTALESFRASSLAPRVSWFAQAGAALAAAAIGDPDTLAQQVARLKAERPGVTVPEIEQAFAHLLGRSVRIRDAIGCVSTHLT